MSPPLQARLTQRRPPAPPPAAKAALSGSACGCQWESAHAALSGRAAAGAAAARCWAARARGMPPLVPARESHPSRPARVHATPGARCISTKAPHPRATTQHVVHDTLNRVCAEPAACGARSAALVAWVARRHERGLRGSLQRGAVRAGGAGARTRGAAGKHGRGRRERLGDEQAGPLGQWRVRRRAARRPDARRAGLQAQHLAQAEEPPQQAVGQPGAAPAQPGERCRTHSARPSDGASAANKGERVHALVASTVLQNQRAPNTARSRGASWARERACGGLGAVQLCNRRADVEGPPALGHRRRPGRVVHTACSMADTVTKVCVLAVGTLQLGSLHSRTPLGSADATKLRRPAAGGRCVGARRRRAIRPQLIPCFQRRSNAAEGVLALERKKGNTKSTSRQEGKQEISELHTSFALVLRAVGRTPAV